MGKENQVVEDPQTGWAAFIDVETTGLSPVHDEIIELAIALFKFDRQTGRIPRIELLYSGLREPSKRIPKAATRVNGITNEDVKGHQLNMPVIDAMIQRAEFLVAHNAQFDRAFVETLFYSATKKKWKCSMRQIPWRQWGYEKRSLQYLFEEHFIFPDQAHRAADDVVAALQLLNTKDGNLTYFHELINKRALPRRSDDTHPRAEPVEFAPFDIDMFLKNPEIIEEEERSHLQVNVPLERPSITVQAETAATKTNLERFVSEPGTNESTALMYQPRQPIAATSEQGSLAIPTEQPKAKKKRSRYIVYAVVCAAIVALITCIVMFPYTTIILLVFTFWIGKKALKK